MTIALLSDIHGNLPAAGAVFEDMPSVDGYVNAGDVVGYNPYPLECIKEIRERNAVSVQGNHDRAVAGKTSSGFHSTAGRAVEWTRERLCEKDLEWLGNLPAERETVFGEVRVRAVHGAPGAPDRYTYPDEFSPTLMNGEDVLVMGHTHIQAKEEFDDGTVVNPGSVGQPRDGDPRAGYGLLDEETGEVELRRTEYPTDEVRDRIVNAGLPRSLADRLEEGH